MSHEDGYPEDGRASSSLSSRSEEALVRIADALVPTTDRDKRPGVVDGIGGIASQLDDLDKTITHAAESIVEALGKLTDATDGRRRNR